MLLIITENLVGSASKISSSTMGLICPSFGINISSSTVLLTSFSVLITNDFISKLKIRYAKLRFWIIVITLLYEKTLKQSMIAKEKDEKEAQEYKKIYNHYIDNRSEIMKKTSFKGEGIFGDDISIDKVWSRTNN